MAFDNDVNVNLSFGTDVRGSLTLGDLETPLPFVQDLPFPPRSKESFRKALEERVSLKYEGTNWDAATWGETFMGPELSHDLWRDPFLARSIVEPVLPNAEGEVGFREVTVEIDEVSPVYDHALRQYVRNDQAMGILQGHEADVVATGTGKAFEEASSGLWMEELKSGNLPRIVASGLDGGLFGRLADQEEENLDDEIETVETGTSISGPEGGEASGAELKYEDILGGLWVVEENEDGQEVKDDQSMDKSTENIETERFSQEKYILEDLDRVDHGAESGSATSIQSESDIEEIPDARANTSQNQASKDSKNGSKADGKPTNEWAVMSGIPDLQSAYKEIKGSMAMHFPFELDRFQKEAICNLEMGRSVFVAAHTSAGKTVVAEYAFALATKHCTRAVYTSPIKTISNQKFRDFSGKFEVGLMTGDVQIRPDAPCLIMTTEILRSMLYKGADLIRDMEFVIFDEVHYVNDADRGVVWEETIIMLPPHCSIVLLSATVPNVEDFAGWVGRTKRKEVYVSATSKRPVPLEHSLFYSGKLYSICQGDKYTSDGLRKAHLEFKRKNAMPLSKKEIETLEAEGRYINGSNSHRGRGFSDRGGRGRGGPSRGGGGGRRGGGSGGGGGRGGGGRGNVDPTLFAVYRMETIGGGGRQTRDLLQLLEKKDLLPTVIFAFSKKWCDHASRELGRMDLTTSKQKHEIHTFCEKALSRLNETDRQLPQILRVKELLKRGMAVHHAGLLPIMKEVVEMLFCRGLVKVLFATETFAMGVNAPARAVVFNSLRKHDGQEFRTLLAGEYTQMAGRAGRRGLDKVGTVIICSGEELPEEIDLRKLLKGRGLKLTSRFRLTYSMILNLMRVEDLKVEDMLKRSFAEFHAQKAQPGHMAQVEKAENAVKNLQTKGWPECYRKCSREIVQNYHRLTQSIRDFNEKKRLVATLLSQRKIQEALKPGRAILVSDPESGLLAAGVILGVPEDGPGFRGKSVASTSSNHSDKKFQVLSLHRRGPWEKDAIGENAEKELGLEFGGRILRKSSLVGKNANGWGALPQYDKQAGSSFRLAEIDPMCIVQVFKEKVATDCEDILHNRESPHLAAVIKKLRDLEDKVAKDRITVVEVKLQGLALPHQMKRRQECIKELLQTPCHRCSCLVEKYSIIHTEHILKERLGALKHKMSDATLKQMPEFQNRVKVLEDMGYVDETGTVKLKGRVACEINSGDELVATEMIFTGLLTELEPEEAVALVSAFVFQEKTQKNPQLTRRMQEACQSLYDLCLSCAMSQQDHGLDLDPVQHCEETLNFGLVEVVYEWAKGTPFKEICGLTSIMEGSIVRTIVRLEQACREMMDAARVMGNTSLFVKMQQASALIKRDVIFAASLYVS
ncbi:hypothetical protein BSKO_00012 [Bryopsis sp. KO-2023]|nr:hypothetical protein BSKO_00012 [Bryopsis sp. KO-2023]